MFRPNIGTAWMSYARASSVGAVYCSGMVAIRDKRGKSLRVRDCARLDESKHRSKCQLAYLAIGPPALVEKAGEESKLAIEQRPLALGPVAEGEGAQTKVSGHGVAAIDGDLQVVPARRRCR